MEFYHVEITKEALADLEQIYAYIALKLSGPGRVDGIRRMQVDNYSVFYVIRGSRVVVNLLYSFY